MFWKVLQYWERRKAQRHWVIFVIVILLVASVLASFNGLGQPDRLIIDAVTRLDGRTPSSEIVIITIDDDSVSELGQWPWNRQIHAAFLDQLHDAGALVVGLDIIMTEPDLSSAQTDMVLADAIKRNNSVILPIFVHRAIGAGGWMNVVEPIPALAHEVASLAHINLSTDSDGVARSVYYRQGRDGVAGGVWNHLAVEMWLQGQKKLAELGRGTQKSINDLKGVRAPKDVLQTFEKIESEGVGTINSNDWLADHWALISYAAGPNSFQRYSYIDVFDGALPKDVLRDKYVLVGATATGMGDAFSTPMTGQGALMPGVEIIANVLDSLLQDEYRYTSTVWQNLIFNLLVVALFIPLMYLGRPRVVLFGVGGIMLFSLISTYLIRRYVGVQVAPVASLITLTLAYPFWGWRRLEQAMNQIRREFSRMRRENGFFEEAEHVTGDRLERDLQAFESASWQLRDLQQMVRRSMDSLPYIMMLTTNNGQVLLSNMQARQFFKVDPPLPTMAFEPAMGVHDSESSAVRTHLLPYLLSERFIGSLLNQEEANSYARDLLLYLRGENEKISEGGVEVIDAIKGESYLLRIIARVTTIEQSQGWIVTLVNLGGGQQTELQRDQVLRYLQEAIMPKLLLMQHKLTLDAPQKEVVEVVSSLNKQVNAFLDFQYVRTAIYFYEKINLYDILQATYSTVAGNAPSLVQGEVQQLTEQPITIEGDSQMLESGLTDLLTLMVKISRGNKMPQVKLLEQRVEEGQTGIKGRAQVMLLIALKDLDYAQEKGVMFTYEIQHTAIPEEVDPDQFTWWGIKAIINRHSGTIRVQRNPHSLGVVIEF